MIRDVRSWNPTEPGNTGLIFYRPRWNQTTDVDVSGAAVCKHPVSLFRSRHLKCTSDESAGLVVITWPGGAPSDLSPTVDSESGVSGTGVSAG